MNHHNKTVVGLDVHKETIVGVSLFPDGQVDQRFQIKNRPEFVLKMIDVLKKRHGSLECVYEAGPCGFDLYRQLTPNHAVQRRSHGRPAELFRKAVEKLETDEKLIISKKSANIFVQS